MAFARITNNPFGDASEDWKAVAGQAEEAYYRGAEAGAEALAEIVRQRAQQSEDWDSEIISAVGVQYDDAEGRFSVGLPIDSDLHDRALAKEYGDPETGLGPTALLRTSLLRGKSEAQDAFVEAVLEALFEEEQSWLSS